MQLFGLLLVITLFNVVVLVVLHRFLVRLPEGEHTRRVRKRLVMFGMVLIIGAITLVPLYKITALSLTLVFPNWVVQAWVYAIFLGYPVCYYLSVVLSLYNMRQDRGARAALLANLPSVPLLLLCIAWVVGYFPTPNVLDLIQQTPK